QRHRADHHRLLRSSGDNNLVGVTARASVIAQIGCDRFAKVWVAADRCILAQMSSLVGEDLSPEPLPNFDGKFVERRYRRNKGDTRRPGDAKIILFYSAISRHDYHPVVTTERLLDQPLRL